MAASKQAEEKRRVSLFLKEQILSSSKYANHRDLLQAVLEDEKSYSEKDISSIINKFMKGRVN